MNRDTVVIVGPGVLGMLGGCAGQAVRKPHDEVRTYCAQQYADKAIDPVRAKIAVPIRLGEPLPIERLADRTRPSDAERPGILALAKAIQNCNAFGAGRLGAPPAYRSASSGRLADALAQLYGGDVTFGQFSRETLLIGERDQLARQRIDDEIQLRGSSKAFDDAN